MARILAVGNATLDIINVVTTYPAEDREVRALSQQRARGGNATNTLVVLSQLGHHCSWAGTLADEPDARFILDDLHGYRIATDAVDTVATGKVPTSYVSLSQDTGSRTIVHFRDLPEYSQQAFNKIDPGHFDWVHFEGRNIEQVQVMLHTLRQAQPALPVSIEIEKPRPGIEKLFNHASLLLFSRTYAEAHGYRDAASLLQQLRTSSGVAEMVCSWGKQGAFALDRDGKLYSTPAFVPARIVDTLGAGDTFNAGMIHARLMGETMEQALVTAARLAGKKCGIYGFQDLV